ncbi:hypothetical protein [Candidatus Lokiarchaeum ossiferum]|uniref:hypothetical protein n=1 Tax=Candidatus Lokiarchaeum ossiferum TaxID=2951803 RepID=UPI00352D507E
MSAASLTNPVEILKLLNSKLEEDKSLGYEAFLRRTHWFSGTTANDLKQFACNQLNVKPRDVLASIKNIEPAFLWASQDGLETAKLKMVEAAHAYSKIIEASLPPVIVWNFFDSQAIRLIVHDGHHRTYYAHRNGIRIPAVILEPLGNYSKMEDKFRYAFQIRTRVIDLPVSRTKHFDIVTR